MKNESPDASADRKSEDFWFPVKAYGWGWGLPVRWQGWLVLLGYFGGQYLCIRHFRPLRDLRGLLMSLAALTILLIVIVVVKGERPVGWRWRSR